MSTNHSDIPEFVLHGEREQEFDSSIQPALELRSWNDVSEDERIVALQELSNSQWLDCGGEILSTVDHLNHEYLRLCPGKNLHKTRPRRDGYPGLDTGMTKAAGKDFCNIFLIEGEPLVLRMLSKFASLLIESHYLNRAKESEDPEKRKELIEDAFKRFGRFSNCINHIFEQFAVNQLLTRNGFVPRSEDAIEDSLHKPTLKSLSDPKWAPVNIILAQMFEDYRQRNFSEAITKAHSAVHSFLQVLVGEPGTNAKGEVGKLIKAGKNSNLIPTNRFTEPFLTNIQSYITSERATNSTAKPSMSPASGSDALLMINMTLLFLQHCLSGGE